MKGAKLAHAVLEQDLFTLERGLKRQLKVQRLPESIRDAFAAHDLGLRPGGEATRTGPRQWRVGDAQVSWVIRDTGNSLLVSKERSEAASKLAHGAFRRAARGLARVRNKRFVLRVSLSKRFLDRPSVLMINVGGGKWYQPGWKAMDFPGTWYQYSRSFIDYPLDLMKMTPFPLEEGSVRLYYSEHVFEHFPNEVCSFSLGEMFRTLEVGGGARIVVPDADFLYEKFAAADAQFFEHWMDAYNATMTEAFVVLFGYSAEPVDEEQVTRAFGVLEKEAFFDRYTENLRYDYARAGEHINWFTFQKLASMLRAVGFTAVTRSAPQGSMFPEIRGPNFDTRPHYSLHVDAAK